MYLPPTAHNTAMIDCDDPSSFTVPPAALPAVIASKSSFLASMGNNSSVATHSKTDDVSISSRKPQAGIADISERSQSMQSHQAFPMAKGAVASAYTNSPNVSTAKMDTIEIIDLCSDSESSDDNIKLPPTKKIKLGIIADTGEAVDGAEDERDMLGMARTANTGGGQERQEEEIPTGLTWKKRSAFRVESVDDIKDESSATTKSAATSGPNSYDVTSTTKEPDKFSAQPSTISDNNANCVVPRIESIRTIDGVRKRKLIGPFVLENDDDDTAISNVHENKTTRSPEDEGYGSCSYGSKTAEGSDWSKLSGLGLHPSRGSSSAGIARSSEPKDQAWKRTHIDEMELYQRRQQSEEKCAEISRRMREEALAKREAERKATEKKALSEDSLENDLRSSPEGGKERYRFDSDDDIFTTKHLSPDDIEAQLDIAQALVNNDGNLPSQKDLSRLCQPPTSMISMGKADHTAEPDFSRNELNGHTHDSIQHPEKQQQNGAVAGTTISGTKHYDQDQAEKYWRKVNKQQRREETWPEKWETGRSQGSDVPSSKVFGSARGEDEASLFVTKGPLRAAPNVNGILAQLVEKAGRGDNEASQAGEPHDGHHATSTILQRVDKRYWTKRGTLRERKRDIENLMSAFMETGKCWCVAFEALSERNKKPAVRELQELKEFAHPILQGYCSRDRAEKRITDIKSNMARRVQKHGPLNQADSNPSQYDIDRVLVSLFGQERLRQGKELLSNVLMESKGRKANSESKSHHKGTGSKSDGNRATRSKRTTPANVLHDQGESESEEATLCKKQNRTNKQQSARQSSEAKIQRIKQAISRYDEATRPAQQNQSKQVRFADECLWDNDFDHRQSSESEVSDEDEDETAPSFGRGNNAGSITEAQINPIRKSVGGKGVSSQLQKANETATTPSTNPRDRPIARKGLATESGDKQPLAESDSAAPGIKRAIGAKSLPIIQHREARKTLITTTEPADAEESQDEADELISDAEDSSILDETDVLDEIDTTKILQYEIMVDYENFGNVPDTSSESLGRHMDAEAAYRQMTRVGADISAWAAGEYRYTKTSWDTDDFELATHTTILPTGGECRVRMVKTWAPAPDWPGKHRAVALARPKVFYLVHETRTTSLRPCGDIGGGSKGGAEAEAEAEAETADLFGPEDFEDAHAVVERERDWCFTSRRHANEVARDRLTAFTNRHGEMVVECGAGTMSAAELAEYIEQIEHDKECFEQERKAWVETAEARKGKVEIKIWVEELIADLPHV
jgi:hypothetical protein